MSDLKSYMVGPKAENMELFRDLIVEVLEDHMYWRRNYYPEDEPAISIHDKHSEGVSEFKDNLRDLIFKFVSDTKQGIPFFSPRYIGHMNTDLLLPGLVGYFAAMLYNQNNVSGESSPVTVELESEVIDKFCRMIGFTREDNGTVHPSGWGYLTSCGTTANFYGLWVARNLRTWPVSLRLAIEHNLKNPDSSVHRKIAETAREISIPNEGTIMAADLWSLLNLSRETLYGFRSHVLNQLRDTFEDLKQTVEDPKVTFKESFLNDFTVGALGERKFDHLIQDTFDKRWSGWKLLSPGNEHYSWRKAANLLGMGSGNIISDIDQTGNFDMDVDDLEQTLQRCLDNRQPVLLLASIFGYTEEGSLDNLPRINELLEEYEEKGLTVWHHVDACYGGYLASMIRKPDSPQSIAGGDEMKEWLANLAGDDFDMSLDQINDYIYLGENDPDGDGWLSWDELVRRIEGMKDADSISIDPHKLGYIPYPAGAVVLRDRDAKEVVSTDAPYLWQKGKDRGEEYFMGRYTLEGSRPGAAAASCWLAHESIPLDRSGHGKLIGGAILATRQLYHELNKINNRDNKAGIIFANKPHSNILCYFPYHEDFETLNQVEQLTKYIIERFEPDPQQDFQVVDTEVNLTFSIDRIDTWFHGNLRKQLRNEPPGTRSLNVIRSVVMGPFSLNAQTRPRREESKNLFQVYSKTLEDEILTLYEDQFSSNN